MPQKHVLERAHEIVKARDRGDTYISIAHRYGMANAESARQIYSRWRKTIYFTDKNPEFAGLPQRIIRVFMRNGITDKEILISRLNNGMEARGIGNKGAAILSDLLEKKIVRDPRTHTLQLEHKEE